ncbi:MAG: hypothetical protein ACXW3E_14420, partial [Thermoanaerobaculia bacterium]
GLIAFFGHDIILIWTRMPDVSREAAPIAACLILGSALNGMMTPPYALQLANGASSLGLSISSAQLVVYVPAVIVLASRYGVLGAAAAWVFINAAYVLVGIPITHRRFLGTAGFDWIRDVGPPLVAAFAVTGGASLFHLRMQRLPQLLWITAVGVLATLAALAFAPSIRSAIAAFLRKTETQ